VVQIPVASFVINDSTAYGVMNESLIFDYLNVSFTFQLSINFIRAKP
jgi:hypothetical protein